ncbi:hypothetical Protein YC6258_05954 [Gynuella sunshinyii YC6258]|uniref:Uncharacterized protein n=1 Tax=Gynuella sunshinyii YC6258 TaxID=1445510 RepID=A0A0C5VXB4_9GAMM|nr:hypothetical Protein YC6258_05954 [Gynuella sunshinyii YC6258]
MSELTVLAVTFAARPVLLTGMKPIESTANTITLISLLW